MKLFCKKTTSLAKLSPVPFVLKDATISVLAQCFGTSTRAIIIKTTIDWLQMLQLGFVKCKFLHMCLHIAFFLPGLRDKNVSKPDFTNTTQFRCFLRARLVGCKFFLSQLMILLVYDHYILHFQLQDILISVVHITQLCYALRHIPHQSIEQKICIHIQCYYAFQRSLACIR